MSKSDILSRKTKEGEDYNFSLLLYKSVKYNISIKILKKILSLSEKLVLLQPI